MTALVEASGVRAGYHGVPAIDEVDLEVRAGEMVLLAGANGAGKTTTVKALSGSLPLMAGSVSFFGAPTAEPLHRRVRRGVGVVTEARTITMGLTVRENLNLAGAKVPDVLTHFPELECRLEVKAGLLSGGEQQMLSLGRILATNPKVILADELSQGLAPVVVRRLVIALRQAADSGVGVLLVEQHVRLAVTVVDRAYLMRSGRLRRHYAGRELVEDDSLLREMYL